MERRVRRSLVGVSGIGAVVGGGLWATKSIIILVTGSQPDYLFELAPIGLAAAALGLAIIWREETEGRPFSTMLGSLAVVATTGAAVSYLSRGDDEGLLGPL